MNLFFFEINKILYHLLIHKWNKYAKREFFNEGLIYFLFFLLTSINGLLIFAERASIKNPTECIFKETHSYLIFVLIIDFIILLFAFWLTYAEIIQLLDYYKTTNFSNYYKSIWNWIDWISLALIISTVFIDLLNVFCVVQTFEALRILHAIAIFFIWLKMLSFFRISETFSFFVKMFLLVLADMKNFIIFMFYLLLAFSLSCNLNFKLNFSCFFNFLFKLKKNNNKKTHIILNFL